MSDEDEGIKSDATSFQKHPVGAPMGVDYSGLFNGREPEAVRADIDRARRDSERRGYREGLREGTELFSRRLERLEEDTADARIMAKLACLAVILIAIALASRPPAEVPR